MKRSKFLICSKISFPHSGRTLPDWESLKEKGHSYIVVSSREELDEVRKSWTPDAIIGMGVGVMEETFAAKNRWQGVPLFCYNWDCYEWVWTTPREGEYDYERYGELLKQSTQIWVPSYCTGVRTTQWWNINVLDWKVVLSSVPYWEADDSEVTDEGYILCTLREIPDRCWGNLEKVCVEHGLPLWMTKHELTHEKYRKAIAQCKFLVSPLYELSTGGLSLLEGYYHGKPVLLSDSFYHGGKDYFGTKATYFRYQSTEDLAKRLHEMLENPPTVDREEAQQWVRRNFSDERMVNNILHRVSEWVF